MNFLLFSGIVDPYLLMDLFKAYFYKIVLKDMIKIVKTKSAFKDVMYQLMKNTSSIKLRLDNKCNFGTIILRNDKAKYMCDGQHISRDGSIKMYDSSKHYMIDWSKYLYGYYVHDWSKSLYDHQHLYHRTINKYYARIKTMKLKIHNTECFIKLSSRHGKSLEFKNANIEWVIALYEN